VECLVITKQGSTAAACRDNAEGEGLVEGGLVRVLLMYSPECDRKKVTSAAR
jgi:hypothetical protein